MANYYMFDEGSDDDVEDQIPDIEPAPVRLVEVTRDGNSLARALALGHDGDESGHPVIRASIVEELKEYSDWYSNVLFGVDHVETTWMEAEDIGEWIPLRCLQAYANLKHIGVVLHSRTTRESDSTNGPSRTFLPLRHSGWKVEELSYVHIAWSDDNDLDHFVVVKQCTLIVTDIYGISRISRDNQTMIENDIASSEKFVYVSPVLRCQYTSDRLLDFIVPRDNEEGNTALERACEDYRSHLGDVVDPDAPVIPLLVENNEEFHNISEGSTLDTLFVEWTRDPNTFGRVEDFSLFFPHIIAPVEDTGVPEATLEVFPFAAELYEAYGKSVLLVIDMFALMLDILPDNYIVRLRNMIREKIESGQNQDGSGTTARKYAGYILRYVKFCKYYNLPSCLVTENRVLQFLKMEQQRPGLKSSPSNEATQFMGVSEDGTLPFGVQTSAATLRSSLTALSALVKIQQCAFPKLDVKLYTPCVTGEITLFKLRVERTKRDNYYDRHSEIYDEGLSTDETSIQFIKHFLSEKESCKPLRNAAQARLCEALASRGKWSRMVKWPDAYFVFMGKEQIPTIGFQKILAKKRHKGIAVGMARHKDVRICPVAFMGLHLFKVITSHWDKIFDRDSGGFHRFSDWADTNFFYGKHPKSRMSRNTQATVQKRAAKALNIRSSHTGTHLWRNMAFHKMEDNGVDNASANRQAGNSVDVSQAFYKRKRLPQIAIKTQAGFAKDEPYRLKRAVLKPPKVLIMAIFPFIEDELRKHAALLDLFPYKEDLGRMTVPGFLNLLARLRLFILQDAPILIELFPNLAIWKLHPFTSKEFLDWAKQARAQMSELQYEMIDNLRRDQVDNQIVYAVDFLSETLKSVSHEVCLLRHEIHSLRDDLKRTLHTRDTKQTDSNKAKRRKVNREDECREAYSIPGLGERTTMQILADWKNIQAEDKRNGGSAAWRSDPSSKNKHSRILKIVREVKWRGTDIGKTQAYAVGEIECIRKSEDRYMSVNKTIVTLAAIRKAMACPENGNPS